MADIMRVSEDYDDSECPNKNLTCKNSNMVLIYPRLQQYRLYLIIEGIKDYISRSVTNIGYGNIE